MRISLNIHDNRVKRNGGERVWRGEISLFSVGRKIGSRPISRTCLIASVEGWIRHREFEICFLSNSLSVTYRSGMHVRETVGESRYVMHCCRVFRQPILRFELDTWSIFEFSTESQLCMRARDTRNSRSFGELLSFFFFFFEHYQVYGKLHLFSIFKIPSFRSLCKFNLKYRQFRNVFCKLSNDSWSLNRLLLLVI